MNTSNIRYFIVIFLILIAGCKEGRVPQERSFSGRLDAIPQAKWDVLAEKRIFFGHQSVGQNIMSGVGDVMQSNPAIKLDIRETSRPEDFEKPVFAHARIGENMNPKSKIDHFRRIMEGGVGRRADIAFFKLCYVDVDRMTDVEALFRYYDEAMTYLTREFPNLKIITVTVPLTISSAGIKAEIKRMLGRSLPVQDDNVKRNVFNEMMRKRYGASVFDLAGSEATMPDGGKAFFTKGNETFYALNPAFSDDGGHLNKAGQNVVATGLLCFLADLCNK